MHAPALVLLLLLALMFIFILVFVFLLYPILMLNVPGTGLLLSEGAGLCKSKELEEREELEGWEEGTREELEELRREACCCWSRASCLPHSGLGIMG
mgnify:CR=1 FL=1